MSTRIPFWLGLLLGGLASLGTRRFWLPPPRPAPPDPSLDIITEAVVVCDAQGRMTYANAAAQALFGPDGSAQNLCYPSGQPVPPGQTPLARAGRGEEVREGRYVCRTPSGERLLDVRASPRAGGAAAVFRDVTVLSETAARGTAAERTAQTLRESARSVAAAETASLPQAVADGALALLDGLPDAQVRLFGYHAEFKTLTLLAAAPDDRPKRPKSLRQAQPPTLPFDANDPQLWSVYVSREPYQPDGGKSLALPLLREDTAIGHLSLTSGQIGAFDNLLQQDALATLAACAASALAHRQEASRASELAAQMDVLREVADALANGRDRAVLADLVFAGVPPALGVELCLLAWAGGDGLRLAGTAYRDALLFPERDAPHDLARSGEAWREAAETGRTVQRIGLVNPDFQTGPWRAFAGQSGRHSVLSVPMPSGRGVLTVYGAGGTPFSDAQVRFTETLAALLGASPRADRTGS